MESLRLTLVVIMLAGSAGAHRLLRHGHETSSTLPEPSHPPMQQIFTHAYRAVMAALTKPGLGSAHVLHGRRALGEDLSNAAAGAVDNPAAGAEAAAGQEFTLPVALHGLQNWAAVLGQMCKAGAAGYEESAACLEKYFDQTYEMLESLASKHKDVKSGNILATVSKDFPKLEIKDPSFYASATHLMQNNAAAAQFSATGLSVSPCAVPMSPVGISIDPTAVNVAPTLISISATGVNIQPEGINVSPDLIVVGPYDTTVAGQGLNIAPALITVSPTKTAINTVGPLDVAGAKVTKILPALPEPGEGP